MIFHINRATYKSDLSEEERREGVEMLRQSGANPAVTTYVVGPELGAKIAALQARHQQEHPEIAALIAQAASFTVPDGAGQPAAAG